MNSQNLQVYRCGCAQCHTQMNHPERLLHTHINLLFSYLNEQQRRLLAALLAEQVGLRQGGVRYISEVCGISEKTIRRGLKELENNLVNVPVDRIRLPGAGRHTRVEE